MCIVSLKGRLTALETLIDGMSVGFDARQFKKWKVEQEANFKKYKEDKKYLSLFSLYFVHLSISI